MLDSIDLLSRAKARTEKMTGSSTDAATADALGWRRQRVSSVIRGLSRLTDAEVVDVATYVGVDPALALVCVRAEYQQDKGSPAAPIWERLASKLSRGKSAA